MSDRTIVLITFEQTGQAYEAFSKFRDLDFGGVRVDGSAVVERTADGYLQTTNGQDNFIGLGALGGGGLGALVGILGGPLGVLLGFAGGGLIGSAFDVNRAVDSDSVIGEMSQALPPGRAGIIAELDETDPAVIDDFALSHGGTIIRRDEDLVLDEIAAAEDAADAAAAAANEAVREAKKADRKEKREERVQRIKDKFHH